MLLFNHLNFKYPNFLKSPKAQSFNSICMEQITEGNEDFLRIKGNVTIGTPIVSRRNHITVQFFSDSEETSTGFHALFKGQL